MNAVVTNVARQRVAIDDIKPYPAMKPSGVEWLGDVPVHWERRKLRQILTPISERNRPDLPLLSVVRERGVILRNVDSRAENHNIVPEDLTNYKVVQVGHFAMNKMKAWQGSYGVSRFHGLVSPAYFVFDLSSVWPHFFHVAIRSRAYVPSFIQASDGVRIGQWDLSQDQMKEIPFFIPSPAEQVAIVRYLDHVDRRISRYIRAKQRLIELIEEEKQAIIHRAVTRGLDPDVPLKPSGVEWLGDVPEHWDVRALKMLCSQSSLYGANVSAASYTDDGVRFLRTTDITDSGQLRPGGVRLPSELVQGYMLKDGDVLISRSGTVGRSFLYYSKLHGPCAYAGYLVRFVPKSGVVPEYIFSFTKTQSFSDFLRIMAISSTIENVNGEKYAKMPLLLPPVEEQTAIVNYVGQATANIDAASDRTRREIELLGEYRTRLIADVVTGKLDVREAAADLPEVYPKNLEDIIEIDDVVADELDAELEEVAT